MKAAIRIAVAMTCFNRRETTLRCLRSLLAQHDGQVEFVIYLVDDASTDGTAAAIRLEFPQVHVIAGTGRLFWGGGMHRALCEALRHPADFILWLNDDVALHPGAIALSLNAYRRTADTNPHQIMAGATTDPETGAITYSGFRRSHSRDPSKLRRVDPDPERLLHCDTMNGNFVLMPRALAEHLGAIDPAFVHQLGDLDYGYRARAIGAGIRLLSFPVGTCAANPREMPFRKPGLNLLQRWRAIAGPLGLPLRPWSTFMWRHGGTYGLGRLALIYAARLAGR